MMGPPGGAPMMGPPGGAGGAPMMAPMGGAPMMSPPPAAPFGGSAPMPATAPGVSPPGSAQRGAVAPVGMVICPRCGTSTPVGFAYCQQCGLHMQALQPTDPGANARPRAPSSPGAASGGTSPNPRPLSSAPVDQHGATLAADGVRANSLAAAPARAASVPGVTWGTAILVNRDGSDGQRFTLSGEYSVVGRAGADIAFEEDRFLARQHARFERSADGTVKVLPLDTLNGVFRKADVPIDLIDGMTVLVGREVLRYEKLDAEEIKVQPLVRHGVALFGSPPREPWGRLVQIVPSGGYRDVRHLVGDEIVLGREEGDIVFRDDAFMSRRHAAVTWDGRRAQITDLGSSNGTFVRITGPTVIKNGDHVRMGDQLLRIELGK